MAAQGHLPQAVVGFVFATFAICWAWINFSWFASAFDTDDWLFRVTTMVQMIGVLIMAMGMPTLFASFEHGWVLDNRVMVLGYVVMRLAMVFNWLRVARAGVHRATALRYVAALLVAQVGWVVVALVPLHAWQWLMAGVVLYTIELMGPVLAERGGREGTPWHPEHIAERYSPAGDHHPGRVPDGDDRRALGADRARLDLAGRRGRPGRGTAHLRPVVVGMRRRRERHLGALGDH